MPEAPAAAPSAKPAAATSSTAPAAKPAAAPGKTATAPAPDSSRLSLADQVKPGPAKSKLFADLDDVLQKTNPAATAAGQTQQKTGTQSPDGDKKPGAEGEQGSTAPGDAEGKEGADDQAQAGKEGAAAADKTATADDGKGKKVSPWKLVDQYKGKVSALEKELAEVKKGVSNPQEKADLLKRIETAETRLKEYEAEIKFVDYSKSDEFKTKFQVPYEKAWKNCLADVKELTIEDPTAPNGVRPVTDQDIMELINLPLGKAREVADEKFGPFANDVLDHRKEIKKLFQAQSEALEEARKNGAEREKTKSEQSQKEQAEFQRVVSESWQSAQKEAEEHPKIGQFIKPIEGDDDHNNRLVRGYQIVDEAWSANAAAPGLTAEQRSEIVKKQAAVRHRAAAFGVISSRLEKANSRIADLEKQLEEFKGSEPTVGTTTTQATGGKPSSAKAALFGKLDKMAHH